VEKRCKAGQAIDDSMDMHNACWVPKAINIYSKYVIFIDFTLQQWLHNTPQCYVVCISPALFILLNHRCTCGMA